MTSCSGFDSVTFIHGLQILSCMPNPTDQAGQLWLHPQNINVGACNSATIIIILPLRHCNCRLSLGKVLSFFLSSACSNYTYNTIMVRNVEYNVWNKYGSELSGYNGWDSVVVIAELGRGMTTSRLGYADALTSKTRRYHQRMAFFDLKRQWRCRRRM